MIQLFFKKNSLISKNISTASALFVLSLTAVAAPALSQAAKPQHPKKQDDKAVRAPEVVRSCLSCHTLTKAKAKADTVGPSLYKVYGRKVASLATYDYSKPLRQQNFIWNDETLDVFLQKPHLFVTRTAMHFRGIKEKFIRQGVIDYLKADNQAPLPTVEQMLAKGVANRGRQLFLPCTACHVARPYPGNSIGPNLYGVVGRKIASAPDFDYSQYLLEREGIWTPQNINRYLIERKGVTQGIHYAHMALNTQQKRSDIIAYLKSLSDKPVDKK